LPKSLQLGASLAVLIECSVALVPQVFRKQRPHVTEGDAGTIRGHPRRHEEEVEN
jgi:hypothetical protein